MSPHRRHDTYCGVWRTCPTFTVYELRNEIYGHHNHGLRRGIDHHWRAFRSDRLILFTTDYVYRQMSLIASTELLLLRRYIMSNWSIETRALLYVGRVCGNVDRFAPVLMSQNVCNSPGVDSINWLTRFEQSRFGKFFL